MFFERRIFEPLEMHDSSFSAAAGKRDRVVTVQARAADGSLQETPNPVAPTAPARGGDGLFSTETDFGRFMQLFLNCGQTGSTGW